MSGAHNTGGVGPGVLGWWIDHEGLLCGVEGGVGLNPLTLGVASAGSTCLVQLMPWRCP